MQVSPIREADKFLVRLPDGLRLLIAQKAKLNRRSMNSEIVFHLEQAMTPQRDANETASEGGATPPKASPEA